MPRPRARVPWPRGRSRRGHGERRKCQVLAQGANIVIDTGTRRSALPRVKSESPRTRRPRRESRKRCALCGHEKQDRRPARAPFALSRRGGFRIGRLDYAPGRR